MRQALHFIAAMIFVLVLASVSHGAKVDSYPAHNGTPGQDDVLLYMNMTDADGSRTRHINVGYLMSYLNFQESWTMLGARTTSGKASQYPLTTNGTLGNMTQPDYPRNVVFTVTDADASLSDVWVCVNGTGSVGNASTTEYFNCTLQGTYEGSIPFAHIASIEVIAEYCTDTSDTIDFGYGNWFGTANRLGSAYKYTVNGTQDNATTYITRNASTYAIKFADVPDGTGNRTVWYKTSGQ